MTFCGKYPCVEIVASQPAGGVNGQFTYQWYYSITDGATWHTSKTGGKEADYTFLSYFYRNFLKGGEKVLLKRAVYSGSSEPNWSNLWTATFTTQPSDVKLVRAEPNKLQLKASAVTNTPYTAQWERDMGLGFYKKIGEHPSGLLVIDEPKSDQYYRVAFDFQSADENTCATADRQEIMITPPDGDGNRYAAIAIHSATTRQWMWWMLSNLRTTSYTDDTKISAQPVAAGSAWVADNSANYGWYTPTAGATITEEDKSKYGALYNYAVTQKKVCPAGWHVATQADWQALSDGLQDEVAERLKTRLGWTPAGTNIYSFSAEPVGVRNGGTGNDEGRNNSTQWLVGGESEAEFYYLSNDSNILNHNENASNQANWDKIGASIRCVKD